LRLHAFAEVLRYLARKVNQAVVFHRIGQLAADGIDSHNIIHNQHSIR
jgi:hypothetical protein